MKPNVERLQRAAVRLGAVFLGLVPMSLLSAQEPKLRDTLQGHSDGVSAPWRSARTARPSPRRVRTGRSSCGTWPAARTPPPSRGTPTGSVRWPSARTARPWPRGARTRRSSCGTWPAARTPPPSRGTPTASAPWPSARTARPWPRGAGTGRSSCGTWPAARTPPPSRGTRAVSCPWPSARTARPWPRAARTRRSSCGTWPAARNTATLRGTPAGLVRGLQPGRQDPGLGQHGPDDQAVGRGQRQGTPPPSRVIATSCHVRGLQPGRQDAGLGERRPGTVRLWDVASGKNMATLDGHTDLGLFRGVQPGRQDPGLGRATTRRSSYGTCQPPRKRTSERAAHRSL